MQKLTVGMAHFDDFDGALFTLQALAMYHAAAVREIVIVDQSPDTPAGRALAENLKHWPRPGIELVYEPMHDATGTTQSRQRIFDLATSETVVVMDCHVLVEQGALARLVEWIEANPESAGDLLSGPIVLNDLQNVHTHFDQTWRGGMWGTWQTDERGTDPNAEPFEINAMGLGLFACRRDKWPGFNPHFRAFGGEENYIHEKFRQAGRRCLCLPFLRWWHRFERPNGVKYPLPLYGKVRNYVLGFQELGLDLEPVRQHFVDEGELKPETWQHLLADPVGHETAPGQQPQPPQLPGGDTLDGLFEQVKNQPRDLDQHAETIRRFAAGCESIAAMVKRKEWNAILAAARPHRLHVWQTENDPFLRRVHQAVEHGDRDGMQYSTTTGPEADSLAATLQQPVDLLVIDTVHHGDRLRAELERHGDQARRFILLRGTAAFGRSAEGAGGGPGLFAALRPWMQERPEWRIVYHSPHQYGLTVIGRQPADYPAEPITLWGPGHGPGTELKAMLAEMGVQPNASCDCLAKAERMDVWGVAECRRRRDEIVGWIREGQTKWGWQDKIKAAGRGLLNGLAFRLRLSDPVGSLVDEAIRRAELKCGRPKCKGGKCKTKQARKAAK